MPSNRAEPEPTEGIYVAFVPQIQYESSPVRQHTWGTTSTNFGSAITKSTIRINKAYTSAGYRESVTVLVHELLHALGVNNHVPAHLATLMEDGQWAYSPYQDGYLQPRSLLWPVDREALRVLYTRLDNGDTPTDFGAWASTSTHIYANGEHAAFGVASRNGYVEPWAHGYQPTTSLAGNPTLAGSAAWTGVLLGFTPQAQSVAGDARIGVNIGALTGQASFTGLESWAAGRAPGDPGTGTRWGDGDLSYSLAVNGNMFRQTGGDDGILTGAFFGENHEGMGGTLERDDLTAAFGGSR